MSTSRIFRTTLRAGVFALAITSIAALCTVACSSSSSSINPITGITILADTITEGHGCGTAPGEVYRYAVVTWNDYFDGAVAAMDASVPDGSTYAFGNVFDCYADGVFGNLLGSPTDGSVSYALSVGAFDEPTYNQVFGSSFDASPPSLETLIGSATYRFACAATQQSNITALAVCTQAP